MCHTHQKEKKILKLFVTYEGGGFKKGGLRGSKNDFFEKIFPKSKGLQKLGTKHAPKEDFQKSQNFEFFQKKGVKGVKK